MNLFEMLQSCDVETMALFIFSMLDQQEKDLAMSLHKNYGVEVDIISFPPEVRVASIAKKLLEEVGDDYE